MDPNTTALVMYDVGTQLVDVFPKATKSEDHTIEAFQEWCGKDERMEEFYSDNATEFKAAARFCNWRMPTATAGQPQTNGLAERMVRAVKDGARALSSCNLGCHLPVGGARQ